MSSSLSVLDDLATQSPLTILQKIVRLFNPDAPHFNQLGRSTIMMLADKADLNVPDNDVTELLERVSEKATSAISGLFGESAILQGAALGLSVGVGTVLLQPKEEYFTDVNHSGAKKKLLTVGLYVAGGILASIIVKQLEKRNTSNKV